MDVVFTDAHRSHDPERELVMGREVGVYETPARAEQVAAALRASGHAFAEPTEHGRGPVEAVHDRAFVDHLERAWDEWSELGWTHPIVPDTIAMSRLLDAPLAPPAGVRGRTGYYVFDTATPMVAGTYPAARAAADCALTAADRLLSEARSAFALCRPPGHHAGTDFAGGYCFLNNAAVAGAYLRDRSGAERVAFLDLDFHHGNGTQQIFYERADVQTISIHADPRQEFPYFLGYADERGFGIGEGYHLNLPLPWGSAWPDYEVALDAAVKRIIEHGSEVLVVSLGLDTFEHDPISRFKLRHEDYLRMGQKIAGCDLPTLFVMEGGYAVDALGLNTVNVLKGYEEG
jgi:acetoin utilization deacetylase AcuC-like enzyme